MSWLSSTTLATSDTPVLATVLNNLALDIRAWGGNVDAATNSLSNLGGISFASGGALTSAMLAINGTAYGARPSVGTSRITGEISAAANAAGSDAGLLRISAGGGTTLGYRSYIDLSGYSAASDLNNTIVFGVGGSEKMRLDPNGFGIGATPTSKLQVAGLPSYASNAAAITGGLTAGAFYRNGDNVCVVH